MKLLIAVELAACLGLASMAHAQPADADMARRARMDDAYRQWQQGAPSDGRKSTGAGVSGQATPDDGSRPGWTTGTAKGDLKATGRAVKKGAQATGHAVAEGARQVGRAASSAGHRAKEAVTGKP